MQRGFSGPSTKRDMWDFLILTCLGIMPSVSEQAEGGNRNTHYPHSLPVGYIIGTYARSSNW